MNCFIEKLPKKITEDELYELVLFGSDFLKIEPAEIHLIFGGLESGIDGMADYEEGICYIHIRSNIPKKELAPTIFHEMVHLKQMLDGRFTSDDNDWFWKGKKVENIYDLKSPWEREARKLEKLMIERLTHEHIMSKINSKEKEI